MSENSASFEPRTLNSPSGAALALRTIRATAPERAVLLIFHGLADHAARYRRFADFMAARGFHVYVHDHRGHGATKAPDAPQGVFALGGDGRKNVLADCLAVRESAAANHPGLPVFVFGHSMGGLIALNFATAYPDKLDALAVWNSNFDVRAIAPLVFAILRVERMLLGSDVPSRMLPALTFNAWAKAIPERKTDFDWLSQVPEEVQAYIDDPLCGWDASVSMWRDIFRLTMEGGDIASLDRLPTDLPVHLVGGGKDPATNGGKAITWLAKRMRARGMSDVTGRIYETLRHETLNENLAEGAMEDFSAWADRVLANK